MGGSGKARMQGHGDSGARPSTESVPALRGRGIGSAAMEHIAGSVTERGPRTIFSVCKFVSLYSWAWRDWKTLTSTTHSAACQQCQHTDESCQSHYLDKGVMACEHCLQCKMHCLHIGGVMANMLTVTSGSDLHSTPNADRGGVRKGGVEHRSGFRMGSTRRDEYGCKDLSQSR